MSSSVKGPAGGKGVVVNPSVLSNSPSGLSLYRSLSSPFTSPRKSMSSPSILRRRATTPTNKSVKLQSDDVLPALPAVVQPDEKDVQSIVLSPAWVPVHSRVELGKPPRPSPVGSGASKPVARQQSSRAWSGRVFVRFATDEDEAEPNNYAAPSPKPVARVSNKRKREKSVPAATAEEEESAREQFSSNMTHVLLAMAELKDEEEETEQQGSGDIGPQVDLVSQLLLEAESSAKCVNESAPADSGAALIPDGINGVAAIASASDQAIRELKSSPEGAAQAMLESALQAPVSPGVAIA